MLRLLCLALLGSSASAQCGDWPAWSSFREAMMEPSGRIVDSSDPRRITTSEGQSYALFFALVAQDQKSFDLLLKWTEDNLAAADLTTHLPAWLWGRKENGEWGVLDSNAASDADLLIAYTLLEAGRLWHVPRYEALGKLLARRIIRDEVRDLPGLGPTLLPGPVGFEQKSNEIWKLNPSYLPLPVIKALAKRHPGSNWLGVYKSSVRIILESAPKGFAPDWVSYAVKEGFKPDIKDGPEGSYNAIRVYLWAGLIDKRDPDAARVQAAFRPMAQVTARNGFPPRVVDSANGNAGSDAGPVGFSAAMVPLLKSLGESEAAQSQQDRILAKPPEREAYYDRALSLFGIGAAEERYRFDADGALITAWQTCKPSSSRSGSPG